ncbi:MAG TPA: murein transglycosylase, partial [Pseudonocardiaceae bacterium]
MINGPFAPRRWVLLLFSGTGAVVFALLAWFVVSVIDVPERREEPVEPLRPAVAPPDPGVRPPAVAVPGTGLQGDRRPQAQLTAWAGRLTERLDVPRAALEAYGYAEVAVRDESPRCRITWTVLAGIGRVESNHGRFGGASLGEDGRPSRPIYGIPLDGGPGVREIRDTD